MSERRTLKEYRIWGNMKTRCYNSRNPDYCNYGQRGIKVCDRWKDSFDTFLRDMGNCPDGFTLDRINNDGDYKPSNCRWTDIITQNNNNRNARKLTHNGYTRSVAQWARSLGMNRTTLSWRIECGWSIINALSVPLRSGGYNTQKQSTTNP